jgi:hypothetical protein
MRSISSARPAAHRQILGPLRGWGALLGAWLGAVLGPACTIELPSGFSCGDGYWNEDEGEECEPDVPESYENACVGTIRPYGEADCDPETCKIINDAKQCGECGDGYVDESLGEQCDGDELNGASCPGGVGTLQCSTSCRFDTSACRSCGNQRIDPGEECDPNVGLDELVIKPECKDLVSPYGDALPYSAGTPGLCREDCRWERTTCSYCGNDKIETDGYLIDFDGTKAIPEWCDGADFDRGTLEAELANSACTSANADLRPIIECAANCLDFIPIQQAQPCCYKSGAACPDDDSQVRCCYEVENPGSTLGGCQVSINDLDKDTFLEVCR